jgi:hypothetical protein
MTITHSATARAAATDAVTALLGTNARLKFHPTGATVGTPGTALANLALTTSANGGFSTGGATATAGAITSDTAAVAGTVAYASLQTSGAVAHILCQVAASASDINMTNGLVLASNDTVSCSALTYTALPA